MHSARAIRAAGIACLAASALCVVPVALATGSAAPAAFFGWRFLPAVRTAMAAAETATPSPSPDPQATAAAVPRRHRAIGDGPITLRANGSVDLGFSRVSRAYVSQGTGTIGSAFSVVMERRTEQSSVSITDAAGYTTGRTTVGQLALGYKTPTYGFTYGQLVSNSQSQLGIGGFTRGVSLFVPARSSVTTFLVSTVQQADTSTIRIGGVRYERFLPRGVGSAALYGGLGEGESPARQAVLDLGYQGLGRLSSQVELALGAARGLNGLDSGAYWGASARLDYAGERGFLSFAGRTAPRGFPALGNALTPQSELDFTVRRDSGLGAIGLDLADQVARNGDVTTISRRVTGSLSAHAGSATASLLAGLSTVTAATATLDRTLALQLSESTHGFQFSQSVQLASTAGDSGSAQQTQLGLTVSHRLLGGFGSAQFTRSTAGAGATGAFGGTNALSLTFDRPIGARATLSVMQSLQRSNNAGLQLGQALSSIAVTRRISNVFALRVSQIRTTQTGPGGGTGSSLQFDLSGPLGLGGARTSGRANPHFPATISGIVSLASDAGTGVGPARGYANSLVVLDGRQTQRTDTSGSFEFRFVTPGTHTVSLEPTTLAPGLVADREVQTITVQGGQIANVAFAVGNFAGLRGQVLETVGGKKVGVPNVQISVDSAVGTQTDASGRFALGRLAPGAHTVKLLENSIPSTLQFADLSKNVTVTTGLVTPVVFEAVTLGSVGGRVLLAPEGGFGEPVGLRDAYVVAQPGDHAAITGEDGSFLLDNLAPGTYQLSVDKDTIPDGNEVQQGPDGPITIAGGASVSGIVFRLGPAAKAVVMTYSNGRKTAISTRFDPLVAPPGALVKLIVTPHGSGVLDAPAAESDVFGKFPLVKIAGGAWSAAFLVPPLAKGNYAVQITSNKTKIADGEALFAVDPAVPLVTVRFDRRAAQPGRTVRVVAKILAPFEAGDILKFEDGYQIKLPEGRERSVAFDVRIWQRGVPYNAVLTDKRGKATAFSLR